MLNLRALIGSFPAVVQYVIVLGLVMVLLYVCLTLTRVLGSRFDSGSKKYTFDNPEEYADSVPDLFATTEFRSKKNPAEGEEKKD